MIAIKRSSTIYAKELHKAKEEIARLLERERTGIARRWPEEALKMVVSVGKSIANKPYRAGNRDGAQWAMGDSPMEALGCLVLEMSLHRPITILAVEFEK